MGHDDLTLVGGYTPTLIILTILHFLGYLAVLPALLGYVCTYMYVPIGKCAFHFFLPLWSFLGFRDISMKSSRERLLTADYVCCTLYITYAVSSCTHVPACPIHRIYLYSFVVLRKKPAQISKKKLMNNCNHSGSSVQRFSCNSAKQ